MRYAFAQSSIQESLQIGFLKRLVGRDRPGDQVRSAEGIPAQAPPEPALLPAHSRPTSQAPMPPTTPTMPAPGPATNRPARSAPPRAASTRQARRPARPAPDAPTCPYCAVAIEPAPERDRLCPRCRRPIVVRRVDGKRVLLTREALDVFNAEREREANEKLWTTERRRWLTLAYSVAAPERKLARLESAKPSVEGVEAARSLYLTSLEVAVRAARRAKRWVELARIRRDQAAALYREAGSPKPPPAEVLALHREWSAAALKAAAVVGRDAELVSTGCCSICNKDNGKPFRITLELQGDRLPHADCPRGLCGCEWYPLPDAKTPRARRKRGTPPPKRVSAAKAQQPETPGTEPADTPGTELAGTPEAEPASAPGTELSGTPETDPSTKQTLVQRISRKP